MNDTPLTVPLALVTSETTLANNDLWIAAGVFIIGLTALLGFLATKKGGYGPYNTSTLLILVTVVVASLLFASGQISGEIVTNIFFAVIGFAGGLFTSSGGEAKNGTDEKSSNSDQKTKTD